ncbi:hypothetical protein [Paracoccus actinidiae]|jgi:hypothetical protein|uniref:hypothetical protein n=1 Tax=Paracoccus actinidiae TaxID=3064531 RepID=UPI0027D279C8|nr:hypothetical protein [Paracoccus sp. M09]
MDRITHTQKIGYSLWLIANLTALDASERDRAGRVSHACTAATEPGIRSALINVQEAFSGKAKTFVSFCEWLSSTKARKEPGDIKQIMREHIFDPMEVAADEEILGVALKKRRLHSLRSLVSEVISTRALCGMFWPAVVWYLPTMNLGNIMCLPHRRAGLLQYVFASRSTLPCYRKP